MWAMIPTRKPYCQNRYGAQGDRPDRQTGRDSVGNRLAKRARVVSCVVSCAKLVADELDNSWTCPPLLTSRGGRFD